MVIPRGFIPGSDPVTSSPDFSNVNIDSGTIDGTIIGAMSPSEATFSKVASPEIKTFLTSHNYQYCYDWSALPANSNFKFTSVVHASANNSVSNGVLYMKSDTGEYVNHFREDNDIKQTDIVIINHRCKLTASDYNYFNLIFCLTESEETSTSTGLYRRYLLSGKDGNLYIAGGTEIISLNIDQYHDYTLIKDKNKYYYLFVDGVLVSKIAWSSVPTTNSSTYYSSRNLVFGPYYGSTVYTGEMYSEYFRYSKLREGSKSLNGTSSKVIGGNQDVYNQAETSGTRQSATGSYALGTNQNYEISGNGTGTIKLATSGDGKIWSQGAGSRYLFLASLTGDAAGIYIDTVNGDIAGADYASIVKNAGAAGALSILNQGGGPIVIYAEGSLVYVNNHLYPQADNTYDLGAGSLSFRHGFFGGSIYMSSTIRIKPDGSYVNASGITESRPGTPTTGQCYFDITLNKPIWYNGTNWVDATGTTV